MDYQLIKVEQKEHLTTITINRPEVMNAVSGPTSQEMNQALDDFAADLSMWACIITGAGERAFCAGMDLKWYSGVGPDGYRQAYAGLKGFGGITRRFDLNKPVIAAVNGMAFGGGFEIVLSCDLVVAAENALFGLPEPRVGLMAGEGGAQRLPRRIPYHAAMSILLTGRRVGAEEARALGLVCDVAPQGELMATAEKWAGMIIECSPLAIAASKETVLRSLDLPLPEALEVRSPAAEAMYRSHDFKEGQKAFAEKRKPQWQNR